jgi:hypothetical protein
MLSHEEVIQAFGGSRQLAEAIGVEPRLAIHWPRRGIPAKHWAKVEITPLAKQRGLTALMLGELPIKRAGQAEAA